MSKSKRGFASMDPEKQRAIASKGGQRAHAIGAAHEFNSVEASLAGQKGAATVEARYGVEHFAKIGHIGGKKSGAKRAAIKAQAQAQQEQDK